MQEITPEYLASQGLSENFPKRFWDKVDKTSSPHGCWLWTAALTEHGYGIINKDGRRNRAFRPLIKAPRASWILCRGEIPKGMIVCHNCPGGDNPRCVNPDHLFLGTRKDNQQDMRNKGRNEFGESRYNAKLTFVQVCKIRSMSGTHTAIARQFGVSRKTIENIIKFKCWNNPNLFV